MLTPEILAAIKAHALSEAPRECCGIIVSCPVAAFLCLPCVNVAPEPEKSFIIDYSAFAEHMSQGTLRGYYHSHVNEGIEFSPADIQIAETVQLPAYVYSIKEDNFAAYEPKGTIVPLLGRKFVFGVHDCVALVDDYYSQKLGIEFEPVPRTIETARNGLDDIKMWLKQRSLYTVSNLRPHDIILMSFGGSGKVNHCAIYLGDGHMLHQLYRHKSKEEVYGGYWKNITLFICRHGSQV